MIHSLLAAYPAFLTIAGLLTIAITAYSGSAPVPDGLNTIAAPGATLQKLAGGFAFTEGPSCDQHGNIYFTDQPNNRILRWSANTGEVSTFLEPAGRSNGTCFDHHGNLWTCADNKNELWLVKPSGEHEVVVTGYDGRLLDGPNDVWIAPNGGAFFTDPFYKRDNWHRGPAEQPCEAVYYLSPNRSILKRVAADLTQPNGLVGTRDGKHLYIGDIGADKTYLYDVAPNGDLLDKRLFCNHGSDGMTIDSAGNIYLTGDGVTVVAPNGRDLAHIPVPEDWTGNICFGGHDRKLLFITASTSIYGLRTRVHGVGSQ